MQNMVTAIDLNTSGIRLVTGYVFQDKVYVLQALVGEPLSVDSNGLFDKKACMESIRTLISMAKSSLHSELRNFVVLLPPDEFQTNEQISTIFNYGDLITQKTYQNLLTVTLRNKKSTDDSYNIYVDPIFFETEKSGKSKVFPLNANADNLNMTADVQSINRVTFEFYSQIFSDLGIEPYLYLVNTFATSSFLSTFNAPLRFLTLVIDHSSSSLSLMEDRRFLFSKEYPFSLDMLVGESAKRLSLSKERMYELLHTFGMRNEEDFTYYTDEKKSLKQIVSVMKESFEVFHPLFEDLEKLDSTHNTDVIFLGDGNKVNGMDSFLSSYLCRPVKIFSPRVMGARNDIYLPCLGGIKITSFNYMKKLTENPVNEKHNDFSHSSISRG